MNTHKKNQQIELTRLLELKEFFLKEPNQLYMNEFSLEERLEALSFCNPEFVEYEKAEILNAIISGNICKTARCVAGWTCYKYDKDFSKSSKSHTYYMNTATMLLGLTEEQRKRLLVLPDKISLIESNEYVIKILNEIIEEKKQDH